MRVATSSNVLHQDVSGSLNYLSVENENYKTTAKLLVSSRQISMALSRRIETKYQETVAFLEECLELFSGMKIGRVGHWNDTIRS